jgi:hypothetical protein
MPTLDIKPDDLKSPTAAVLDRIGSIMLFPHDEARRARLLDAAHNRFVLEQMTSPCPLKMSFDW